LCKPELFPFRCGTCRSVEDELKRESYTDASVVAVSYLVMLGYITFALAALPPPQQLLQLFVLSRAALGAGGVLIVAGAFELRGQLFWMPFDYHYRFIMSRQGCSARRRWELAGCSLLQVHRCRTASCLLQIQTLLYFRVTTCGKSFS
jgi:hypothetical protein